MKPEGRALHYTTVIRGVEYCGHVTHNTSPSHIMQDVSFQPERQGSITHSLFSSYTYNVIDLKKILRHIVFGEKDTLQKYVSLIYIFFIWHIFF